MNVDEFLRQAKDYKLELAKQSGFDEIYALWQRTSLPYSMEGLDPYSAAYKAQVETLYNALTGEAYEIQNELTSTKVEEAQFERGYPWISGRLDVSAAEMMKVSQAMHALHLTGKSKMDIIEFGSGWGNLALPLARTGMNVTCVDIDAGFLARLKGHFSRENLHVNAVQGDFIAASETIDIRFDAAVFQASFHHCLDFDKLLHLLSTKLLKDDGAVYFLSEPVVPDYPFPWGLRYDGESLWAIMSNKWLELGFEQDFFTDLLLRNGFFCTRIPEIPGHVGPGWRAVRGQQGLAFENWVLPRAMDESFHVATGAGYGRFCRASSVLPGLGNAHSKHYVLELCNFSSISLTAKVIAGAQAQEITIAPGMRETCEVLADCKDVRIQSQTFVPHKLTGNGDDRELGLALLRVEQK